MHRLVWNGIWRQQDWFVVIERTETNQHQLCELSEHDILLCIAARILYSLMPHGKCDADHLFRAEGKEIMPVTV